MKFALDTFPIDVIVILDFFLRINSFQTYLNANLQTKFLRCVLRLNKFIFKKTCFETEEFIFILTVKINYTFLYEF